MRPGAIGLTVAGSGVIYSLVSLNLSSRLSGEALIWALVLGLAFFGVGYGLFALAGTDVTYLLAAMAIGAGGGLSFPALMTLAGKIGPGGVERSVTRYTVSLSLSLLIGPLVESAVLALAGSSLRVAFWVFAPWPIVGLLAMAITAPSWRRSLDGEPDSQVAAFQLDGPADDTQDVRVLSYRGTFQQLRDHSFRTVLYSQLAFDVVFTSIVSFGALLGVTQDKIGIKSFTLIISAFYLVSFLIRLSIAVNSPISNKARLMKLSCGSSILGIVLCVLHGSDYLIVGMLVCGIGHGISYPLSLSLIAQDTPTEHLSSANAHLTGIVKITDIILPAGVGFVAQSIGYRGALSFVIIPAVLFSVLALGLIGKVDKYLDIWLNRKI